MGKVRLTQYSHGAGCGCKISPRVLAEIIEGPSLPPFGDRLLVGVGSRDDAAVYDLGDGNALISTTDFFMPIVDDPSDFGRIAAVNAINDIYAMGGSPLMAIAILGWPVDKLSATVAREVVQGGILACSEAGIPLGGGHSIDNPEPLFGLAVTGKVKIKNIKRNNTARPGSILYLTKPLGVGLLTTARKKGILKDEHNNIARDVMASFNRVGEDLGALECVRAMTDVTGFGLLGHLLEMCEGSNVGAVIDFHSVPLISSALEYAEMDCVPGGTERNWLSYKDKVGKVSGVRRKILCDPQTAGGLLIAIDPDGDTEFSEVAIRHGLSLRPIGTLESKKQGSPYIEVRC